MIVERPEPGDVGYVSPEDFEYFCVTEHMRFAEAFGLITTYVDEDGGFRFGPANCEHHEDDQEDYADEDAVFSLAPLPQTRQRASTRRNVARAGVALTLATGSILAGGTMAMAAHKPPVEAFVRALRVPCHQTWILDPSCDDGATVTSWKNDDATRYEYDSKSGRIAMINFDSVNAAEQWLAVISPRDRALMYPDMRERGAQVVWGTDKHLLDRLIPGTQKTPLVTVTKRASTAVNTASREAVRLLVGVDQSVGQTPGLGNGLVGLAKPLPNVARGEGSAPLGAHHGAATPVLGQSGVGAASNGNERGQSLAQKGNVLVTDVNGVLLGVQPKLG